MTEAAECNGVSAKGESQCRQEAACVSGSAQRLYTGDGRTRVDHFQASITADPRTTNG